MKKIFLIVLIMFIYSCSTNKPKEQTNDNNSNLTKIEKTIVNDFLDKELIKERYKNYKDFEIIVIEEALIKTKPLADYEFNYKYKNSWGSSIKEWIIDSLQIKKIKNQLKNEDVYHWKVSDFKNLKVKILKHEELRKTTNTGEYLQNNLIIYLSKPLIIDKNNVLISFEIGDGGFGFYPITHFTVLMRKINNKWVENGYYEDGVFN
ncbi:hypothetical protein [Flavobacterium celericrescens]|uniref:Lipoprotein n=1 Tax=Flavobacterium celericrescens TaxID=2709780 RepID=A0ABX0IA93_9FLAO|nr:hypothetical protein [Flavobacterium celericrescens]NHM04009.1 hypothetical protein [Flavobacterium celericrescens]